MIVRHYKHFETSLMSNHRLQWTLAHTLSFSTVRVYKMALPRVFVCHRSGTPFCTLSWGSLVHWKQTELIQPALFQRPLPHGLLIPNTLYTLFIHIYIYEKGNRKCMTHLPTKTESTLFVRILVRCAWEAVKNEKEWFLYEARLTMSIWNDLDVYQMACPIPRCNLGTKWGWLIRR